MLSAASLAGHAGQASGSGRGCRCGRAAGDTLDRAKVADYREWRAAAAGGGHGPTRRGNLGDKIAAAGDPVFCLLCALAATRGSFLGKHVRPTHGLSPFVLTYGMQISSGAQFTTTRQLERRERNRRFHLP